MSLDLTPISDRAQAADKKRAEAQKRTYSSPILDAGMVLAIQASQADVPALLEEVKRLQELNRNLANQLVRNADTLQASARQIAAGALEAAADAIELRPDPLTGDVCVALIRDHAASILRGQDQAEAL